mmetsp:Transcript_19483/g.40948  ORF Transcript_19483/g.40948 Transcript_19483/m.40948 type:complete len:508 (-) Transcript_19483:493-2016(-)
MNTGDEDHENEDPKNLDNKLSKELLQLSCVERNGIQEEIHGVDCLAREETPELVEASLQKLAMALENDNIVPYRMKAAYRKAQQLFPRTTYVNTRKFRLRFLRNTLFDPTRGALKMVEFLRVADNIFGEQALERPIRFSDFTSKEKQYIRKGHCQFLPFRDRSGRRILAIMNASMYTGNSCQPLQQMNREDRSKNIFFMQAKLLMYMVWTAGCDIDTQRRGIVYFGWFDSTFQPKQKFQLSRGIPRVNYTSLFCVRPSAVHICSPDKPIYRFFRTLILVHISQHNRPKLLIHLGESVELRYLLRSYGMPTEHIPISVTGTLKLGYVKQWMRAREVIEENYASDSNTETIVECPQLDDVLFRQGISLNSNPGNAMVRRLIISTYQKQEIAKVKRRKVVLNIIEEVRKTGGRFLVWNDEGWWNEILMDENEDLLMAKVEYIIKDVRRENRISVRQQQQLLKLNSSTSIFRNPVVSTVPLHSNISDEEDRSSSPSCGQDCLYRSALPTRR